MIFFQLYFERETIIYIYISTEWKHIVYNRKNSYLKILFIRFPLCLHQTRACNSYYNSLHLIYKYVGGQRVPTSRYVRQKSNVSASGCS